MGNINATLLQLADDPVDVFFGRLNYLLVGVLLLLATYIIGLPFWSEVSILYLNATDKTGGYVYESNFTKENTDTASNKNIDQEKLKPIPKTNTLVIPKIHVDASIVEGSDPSVLYNGFWRRPKTSTPPLGGNTVISGHRFLFTSGPNTFYHLDKVSVGDNVIIFWEGKEHDYVVSETKIVKPDAIEIEAPSIDTRLTLYTCTPLWSSTDRLVVIARPKI